MEYFYGKTVEQAIEEGLATLNVDKNDVEITVIDEGTQGGFLGLGAKKAKVGITLKQENYKKAVKFLEGLFDVMKITATCEVEEQEDRVIIKIISTSSSKIIGYRGEVLDSLQTLASAIYNSKQEDYKRVVVDCENYREKRQVTLTSLAVKLAEKAVKTGRKVSLEAMNPYERRIIHSALSENENVKTESVGVEPARHVVIIPNNLKPYEEKNKGFKDKKATKGKSDVIKTTKKTSGFGTYLGNSLKNND
jgi:spoIIIJ-associated protein